MNFLNACSHDVTRNEMDEQIDSVRAAIASLVSSRENERANETRILSNAAQQLIEMRLKRSNERVEDCKMQMLRRCVQFLG